MHLCVVSRRVIDYSNSCSDDVFSEIIFFLNFSAVVKFGTCIQFFRGK